MMVDAYTALDSLRTMLTAKREQFKEKLARGIKDEGTHQDMVGRCKGLNEAIESINQQIKSINGDDDAKDRGKPKYD